MTPHAQRLAIALALGWRWWRGESLSFLMSPANVAYTIREGGEAMFRQPHEDEDSRRYEWTTDTYWLTSLDAMHLALATLTDEQWAKYRQDLWKVISVPRDSYVPKGWTYYHYPKKGLPYTPTRGRAYAEPTAAHKAEAFLKTLGLWVEDAT